MNFWSKGLFVCACVVFVPCIFCNLNIYELFYAKPFGIHCDNTHTQPPIKRRPQKLTKRKRAEKIRFHRMEKHASKHSVFHWFQMPHHFNIKMQSDHIEENTTRTTENHTDRLWMEMLSQRHNVLQFSIQYS